MTNTNDIVERLKLWPERNIDRDIKDAIDLIEQLNETLAFTQQANEDKATRIVKWETALQKIANHDGVFNQRVARMMKGDALAALEDKHD